MPVETEMEQHDDGSVTIWCSDHDPMLRMKGMHGICIHPGRAVLELKVRLYNRTPLTQQVSSPLQFQAGGFLQEIG